MKRLFILFLCFFLGVVSLIAQYGPGGVGDDITNKLWLRASDLSLSYGDNIAVWADASGNNLDMGQAIIAHQPTLQEQDGIKVVRFDPDGGSSITYDYLADMSGFVDYDARTAIIVFRADLNSHLSSDLGQLWGDYQRGVHVAIDARDGVQEFSFDGNSANRAKYGVNGSDYGAYIRETGTNDWINEKFELVVVEFEANRTLNAHYIGDLVSPAGHYLGADIAEIIVFDASLNAAQKIVVENYLASKFDLSLSQNDLYLYDNNYGNEVAGIGQVSGESQLESWSGSVLGVGGLTSLDNGDFLFFGHNGGNVDSWTTTNTPFEGNNIKRIERTWRFKDTCLSGDVGNITLTIDTSFFVARDAGYSKFVVMLDDDGDFSDATRIKELVSLGGNNLFSISNLDINDGDYITIAEVQPVVQFTLAESRGFEDANALINVSSNVELSSNITVQVITSNGGGLVDDADNSTDYTALSSQNVTIYAGSLSANVLVYIDDDGLIENDESFTLTLTSSDINVSLGVNTTHIYTINDNDGTGTVYFSLQTSSLAEMTTVHNIEVTSTDAGAVGYRVIGGSATSGNDFILASGTLNFLGAETQNVSVNILNDAVPESNETIIIELYNPVGFNLDGTNYIEHIVTIDDSAEPLFEVKFTESSDENLESVNSYNISVGLTGVTEQDVEVTYVVSGNGIYGEDHNFSNGTFIIPAGITNYQLELPIIDDNIEEAMDTVIITLTNAVNADLGVVTKFNYYILNDDFGFTGPGGVGSSIAIKQWIRADKDVTVDGSNKVSIWGDYSGNGFDLTQTITGEQPTLINNYINGMPAIAFDGGSAGSSGHDWLSWTAAGTGYQAQEVFAIFRVSDDSMSTSSLGQLWGSYQDSMHVAVEARSYANQQGFSFDGVPDASLTARYGLDGRNFQGQTAGVPSYYTWTYDTWHMISADFPNVNTLEENKVGKLVTSDPTNYWFGGYIAEVAIYSSSVDSADRIIIENYLAAKYGISLAQNDIYAHQDSYGFDVAGIGKTSDTSYHLAAQSAKILKISQASDLGNGEFMLFGHNNADTSFSTTDAHTSYQRIARVWQFDQTGTSVGTLTVDVEASQIGVIPSSATSVVLLIDDDGIFSNGVVSEYTLTLKSGSYQAKNIIIPDDAFVTVACKEPTLTFESNILTGSEGLASQTITVRLSSASTETVTVDYSIIGSDAIDPDDYSVSSASPLVFNPGEVSKTIDLSIVDDNDSESAEYITFKLSNLFNSSLGDYDEMSFYILDNDGLEYQGPAGIGNLSSQVNVWYNNMYQTNLNDGDKIDNATKKWLNQTDNSGLDAYQDVLADQPTFYTTTVSWNKKPIVYLQPGKKNYLKIPDNSFMNTFNNNSPQTQRSIWVVFQPGADVLSRQVVFEEGGGTRGLNIYVENNKVHLGMWNDNDQGGAIIPMPYQSSSAAIIGNKPYFALLEFDYKAADDAEIRGTINGTQLNDYNGNGAALYNHSGDIGLGAMNGGSCFDGDDCDGGTGHFFEGYIAEFASAKEIYNTAQKYILFNYLSTKYGIPITTPDYYSYDVVYGNELFGIGQVDVNNSHYAAQGSGIVKIENPTSINDGEFLLVGHDTSAIDGWIRTGVPNSDSNIYRVERVWRVDETGDLGSITFRIDTTEFNTRPSETLDYCLIIDSDGDFTSGAEVILLDNNDSETGTVFASGIDFNDGDYFTIGCIRPAVNFITTEAETAEGNTTIKIAVELNVRLSVPTTVDYSFSNISPLISNPDDYLGTDGTITIAAGSLSDSISFDIKQDDLGEGNEMFLITLSNTTGGIVVGYFSTHTHTIVDEDLTQKVNFAQPTKSLGENISSKDSVYVFLTAPANGGGLSVDLEVLVTSTASNDSVDYYLPSTQTLTFANGEDSIAVVFDLFDDIIDEQNETIVMRLTNPQGFVNLGDTAVFTYTIVDNDAQPTVSFLVASASGTESVTPVSADLILSAPSGLDIVVDLIVEDNITDSAVVNEDYRFDVTTVTIPAGDTMATYLLDVINDPGYENTNEVVQLKINSVSNAIKGSQDTYTYTIIDDDFGGWEGPGGIGDLDYQIGCWLRSTQVYNITNGSEIGLQGSAEVWADQSNNGNDAYKKTTNEAPIYYDDDATWNKRPLLKFKRFDNEILEIADNDEMNIPSGAQTQRTLIIVFRPGDDVTTRQVLYEEGGGVRGLNIYIEKDSLLIGGYNLNSNDEPAWGDTYWSYVPVKFAIKPNTPYFTILQFDFDGTTGDVRGALNGSDFIQLPDAKKLYRHPDNIGLGGVNGGAKGENNVSLSAATCYYDGYIAEFVSGNFVYNTAQLKIVQNYLAAKYNIDITNSDNPLVASKDIYEFDADYGWEVVGIGQLAGDNTHNKSQGQGVIMLHNPGSMNSGDFMLIGHDHGFVDDPLATSSIEEWVDDRFIDIPDNDTNIVRIRQEWRVNKVNDVGAVTLDVDFRNEDTPGRFSAKSPGYDKYVMLIDDDGDFTSGAKVIELSPSTTLNHDGYYMLKNYDFNHGDYFTIGIANTALGFSDTMYECMENVGAVQNIEVKLNMLCAAQTKVDYKIVSTMPETADANDYLGTATTGTLVFNAWDDSENIAITINDDLLDEDDESFYIILENPTNSAGLMNDTILFVIHDNDTDSKINFSLSSDVVNETDIDFTYSNLNIERSNSTVGVASVNYIIYSGSTSEADVDYILAAGTLNYIDGEVSKTLDIKILGDDIDENIETLILRLSNPVNCALDTVTEFTLTINDDDTAPHVQFTMTESQGAENVSPVHIGVSLSSVSGKDIAVYYTVIDSNAINGGIDYNLLTPDSLVIPAGDLEAYISPDIFNDLVVSSDKVFKIQLGLTPSNAILGANDLFRYQINDDDELGYIGPGGIGDERQYVSWLRAEDETESFGSTVNTFDDQSGNGNSAVKNNSISAPVLRDNIINSYPALQFTGSELLQINGDVQIDNAGFSEKSIVVVFNATNVASATPQVIYEQGGGNNTNGSGFAVYLHNSRIYFNAYNNSAWGYTEISTSISNGSHYAIMVFDEGSGIFSAFVDGIAITPSVINASLKVPTTKGNGLGGMRNGMWLDNDHNGNLTNAEKTVGNNYYFTGYISEYLQYNFALDAPYRIIIENHLASKYNLGIPVASDKFDYSYNDAPVVFYGNNVTGIGQVGNESHSVAIGTGTAKLEANNGMIGNNYLLIGDDQGAIDSWNDVAGAYVGTCKFADRGWRISKEGSGLSQIVLGINIEYFAAQPSDFPTYVIAIDNDPDLGDDEDELVVHHLKTPDGNILRDTITISDGAVIRVGVAKNRSTRDGEWHESTTWLTGTPPIGSNQTAFVTAGHHVWIGDNVSSNTKVGTIIVEPGAVLDINERTAVYDSIVNEGTVNLQASTLLYMYSADISNAGSFNCGDRSYVCYIAESANQDICSGIDYYYLYTNGGNYYIRDSIVAYNLYNFNGTINAVGNPVITLTGQWATQGTYSFVPAQSKLVFVGTSVGLCNLGSDLYDLEINKFGTGELRFANSNVKITNELILTDGKINLQSYNLTLSDGATIIHPGDGSSYVQADGSGRLVHEVSAGNTYEFPIGDNDDYSPFTVTLNSFNAGATPSIGINVADAAPAQILDPSYPHLTRSWTVEPIDVNAPINYDVIYSYVDNDTMVNESDIRPFKWNSVDGNLLGNSATFIDVASNTFNWTGLTSFSTFGGATYEALPIELLYLKASPGKTTVALTWATATELNNDYFEVQRSLDGVNFEVIDVVLGTGNSSIQVNYSYVDNNPEEGVMYYRLKQVDYDGQNEYTPIISVTYFPEKIIEDGFVKIYPNPTEGILSLELEGGKQSGIVRVYSMSGYLVNEVDFFEKDLVLLDLSVLPQSLYVVKVVLNDRSITNVISKQ